MSGTTEMMQSHPSEQYNTWDHGTMKNHPEEWPWDIWKHEETLLWMVLGNTKRHKAITLSCNTTPEITPSHSSEMQYNTYYNMKLAN